jgi:hypothetical protein
VQAVTHLRIALRGFWIVFLTASNVVQVATGHYGGAFVGGFLISATWWSNAHAAKVPVRYGSICYGLGAAIGTVSGMGLTHWWYG